MILFKHIADKKMTELRKSYSSGSVMFRYAFQINAIKLLNDYSLYKRNKLSSVLLSSVVYQKTGNSAAPVFSPICTGAAPV